MRKSFEAFKKNKTRENAHIFLVRTWLTLTFPARKFFHFLSGERTVALEVFTAFINFFFGLYFFITPTGQLGRGIVVHTMLQIFTANVWSILFMGQAALAIFACITGSLRFRKYAAMLHIFMWGVVAYLIFHFVSFPNYIQGIYGTIFLAGFWVYLSVQNETRIFKSGQQTMTIHIPRQILEKNEIKSKL